ncbi:MAG: HSP20 family small heat-shock protein [Bacteroidota bacterium]
MTFAVNYPFNRSRRSFAPVVRNSFPAVNIAENEDGFHLNLAVPGLTKEDLKVEVKEDRLTISFESNHDNETSENGFTRKEFGYRSFNRSFILPDNVDTSAIKAEYEQGVLKVNLPKKEETKPEVISIEVA